MSQSFDMTQQDRRSVGITAAAAAARRGDLIVLPLESSYGVGTDAFNVSGTARLAAAKGRGRDLALPVLIGSPSTAEGLLATLDTRLRGLFEAFWPGPLTVVAAAHPTLSWDLGDTGGVVAVRMPIHPVALELLREVGPMAVTTANIAHRDPASDCRAAQAQFSGLVSIYLDAGACSTPSPSSVIDATGDELRLVREGAYSLETLRTVVPALQGPDSSP